MIIGTAGHIDHGKTALVRALTGVDTDRLPEEKRRGITIDLGFAPLVLDGVGQVGVVDVPGHEAFVRTMVAGASGIDVALLVVAADAGMMPQTYEHITILGLLGVESAVVAITKCDLVDDEWLSLVEADVRLALEHSTLTVAKPVRVSTVSGAGIGDLRVALTEAARTCRRERDGGDLFRMPIDRAFTVKGTGTVVTGTVWSGTIAIDSVVRLLPVGRRVRVRGLQSHGQSTYSVSAGNRVAIALAAVDVAEVSRGAVLVQGDAWQPSRAVRAHVMLTGKSTPVLGPRTRVRFHLGTSEVGARIVFGDAKPAPNCLTPARIVLDQPVVARMGDHFVLRTAAPLRTIGGGHIDDPVAPLRGRLWPERVSGRRAILEQLAQEAGSAGLAVDELSVRLAIPPSAIDELLRTAGGWRLGDRYLAAESRDLLLDRVMRDMEAYHAEHRLDEGAPVRWVRAKLDVASALCDAVLAMLCARGAVAVRDGIVRLSGFAPMLGEREEQLADGLLALLDRDGIEPRTLEELTVELACEVDVVVQLARWLEREGKLIAVEPSRYYGVRAVDLLKRRMADGMTAGEAYSAGQIRDMLGLTRKFTIPFLEYCDSVSYTVRRGQERCLSQASGAHDLT